MTGEILRVPAFRSLHVALELRFLLLHRGKCQENVASLANFRHSARANSVDPT
jgi:hypothetical protein